MKLEPGKTYKATVTYVENQEPHPNAAPGYYHVAIDGVDELLVTQHAADVGVKRADDQPEDCRVVKKGFFKKLLPFL